MTAKKNYSSSQKKTPRNRPTNTSINKLETKGFKTTTSSKSVQHDVVSLLKSRTERKDLDVSKTPVSCTPSETSVSSGSVTTFEPRFIVKFRYLQKRAHCENHVSSDSDDLQSADSSEEDYPPPVKKTGLQKSVNSKFRKQQIQKYNENTLKEEREKRIFWRNQKKFHSNKSIGQTVTSGRRVNFDV